jgi:hypothetical protein
MVEVQLEGCFGLTFDLLITFSCSYFLKELLCFDISGLLCVACAENSEVLSSKSKQPTYEEPPPNLDDAPMSYTPHIKYTKLEFKVRG